MAKISRVSTGLLATGLGLICSLPVQAIHVATPPRLNITTHRERPSDWLSRRSTDSTNQRAEAARKNFAGVALSLRQQFQISPEYTAAQAAARAARQDYQQLAGEVLGELRKSPDYRQKQLALSQAEEKISQIHRGELRGGDLSEAAHQAATVRNTITKIETAALAGNPQVASAKSTFMEAAARVTALSEQFETGLPSEPQWRAARAELDAAKGGRSVRSL